MKKLKKKKKSVWTNPALHWLYGRIWALMRTNQNGKVLDAANCTEKESHYFSIAANS